jgi:hypothetical protein
MMKIGFHVGQVILRGRGPRAIHRSPNSINPKSVSAVAEVEQRHEAELLNIPGVLGAGVGLSSERGTAAVRVYVEHDTPEVRVSIPSFLEGIPVLVVETGPIVAY